MTPTDRKVSFRWTDAGDRDWVQFDDGHKACLRVGSLDKGVRVVGVAGAVNGHPGRVTGFVPTWDDSVALLVEWDPFPGKRPRLPLWWMPDDLIRVGEAPGRALEVW